MSQNGTTPTTDENRPPGTIATPLLVPMMPMYVPYPAGNAVGQPYYTSAVYPNVPAYAMNGGHRQGGFALGYNPFYAPFYPAQNSMLRPATHLPAAARMMPPTSMMPPALSTSKLYSSTGSLVIGSENERNKNLNIRECQSPVLNEGTREKKPLQIVDPADNNAPVRIRKESSSTSSLVSHPELEQNLPPVPAAGSSPPTHESDSDSPQEDFLSFISQKTKTATIPMPELNPFANEFSFGNSKTLPQDSPVTTNGIEHHPTSNDNQSSYRLLFDNLIEKSLESIEAIKKSTKKASVNDISVQCDQVTDCINRSTQTAEQTNHSDLVTDYSLRTLKLMDTLLGNFRSVYSNEYHQECKAMAQTCDELRHLILFIHQLSSSLIDHRAAQRASSMDLTKPFSSLVQELGETTSKYASISQNAGRGGRRLTTSTSYSPMPSFSCRQIDPIAIARAKLCSLCQKPLDDRDGVMHKLCRSFSSRPNASTDT